MVFYVMRAPLNGVLYNGAPLNGRKHPPCPRKRTEPARAGRAGPWPPRPGPRARGGGARTRRTGSRTCFRPRDPWRPTSVRSQRGLQASSDLEMLYRDALIWRTHQPACTIKCGGTIRARFLLHAEAELRSGERSKKRMQPQRAPEVREQCRLGRRHREEPPHRVALEPGAEESYRQRGPQQRVPREDNVVTRSLHATFMYFTEMCKSNTMHCANRS